MTRSETTRSRLRRCRAIGVAALLAACAPSPDAEAPRADPALPDTLPVTGVGSDLPEGQPLPPETSPTPAETEATGPEPF